MYRVLVPVDTDEERARTQARFVAGLPDAAESVEARLLFVFGEDDAGDLPGDLQSFRTATRVASVRRAREVLEDAGVSVGVVEDSGDSAADILDHAETFDADLVVLGGRKRSPAGKAIFGSVTQSVILNTDRPVAVTGTRRE